MENEWNQQQQGDIYEREKVRGHLKALEICWYVWGGMSLLGVLFGVIYVVIGLALTGASSGGSSPSFGGPGSYGGPPPSGPPPEIGTIFAGLGACVTLLSGVLGTLSILAGRGIAKRTNRTLTYVMAGISCLSIPLGTVLGVFTFVVLGSPMAKRMYYEAEGGAASW